MPARGPLWVVSSDRVHWISVPEFGSSQCFQQGGAGPCSGRRAIGRPRDVAVSGDAAVGRDSVLVTSGDGVAVFRDGDQPGGAGGCITNGGTEGCAAGSGLAGAARIAAYEGTAYVGAPGSGGVTALRVPLDGGAPSVLDTYTAPTAALAIPPRHFVADAPSYAGSHLYAGGGGIAPFRRDLDDRPRSRRWPAPAFSPAGAVADLAVSGDIESTAVYAAVPSAGAVVAFARNIPPSCGAFFFPPPRRRPPSEGSPRVPLHCFDANRDPLTLHARHPPARGDGDRLRRGRLRFTSGPGPSLGGEETFTVRVSDGAESTLATAKLTLAPVIRRAAAAAARRSRCSTAGVRMDRRGRVTLRVRCTDRRLGAALPRSTLRASRAPGARVTLNGATRAAKLRLKLPKKVRRAVRRHPRRGVRVKFTVSGRDDAGRTGRASRRVRVRARRAP